MPACSPPAWTASCRLRWGRSATTGNYVDFDGCTSSCRLPRCGDAILQKRRGLRRRELGGQRRLHECLPRSRSAAMGASTSASRIATTEHGGCGRLHERLRLPGLRRRHCPGGRGVRRREPRQPRRLSRHLCRRALRRRIRARRPPRGSELARRLRRRQCERPRRLSARLHARAAAATGSSGSRRGLCDGNPDDPRLHGRLRAAHCGDGLTQPGEDCDETATGAATTRASQPASTHAAGTASCCWTCPRARKLVPEGCDDANASDNDACLTTCQPPPAATGSCGPASMSADEGENNADDGECLSDCTVARCGDGQVLDGIEACDDGNLDNSDGCLDTCVGRGLRRRHRADRRRECDDANLVPGDWCSPNAPASAARRWECDAGDVCYLYFADAKSSRTRRAMSSRRRAPGGRVDSRRGDRARRAVPLPGAPWHRTHGPVRRRPLRVVVGPGRFLAARSENWGEGQPAGGDCASAVNTASGATRAAHTPCSVRLRVPVVERGSPPDGDTPMRKKRRLLGATQSRRAHVLLLSELLRRSSASCGKR